MKRFLLCSLLLAVMCIPAVLLYWAVTNAQKAYCEPMCLNERIGHIPQSVD